MERTATEGPRALGETPTTKEVAGVHTGINGSTHEKGRGAPPLDRLCGKRRGPPRHLLWPRPTDGHETGGRSSRSSRTVTQSHTVPGDAIYNANDAATPQSPPQPRSDAGISHSTSGRAPNVPLGGASPDTGHRFAHGDTVLVPGPATQQADTGRLAHGSRGLSHCFCNSSVSLKVAQN